MMRSHKFHLFLLAAVALLLLPLLGIACGGDDDGGTTTAATTPADGGKTSFDISAGDNFFEYGGEKKPTLSVPAGKKITINITNDGTAIHNMRFAGDDNKYDSSDDAVSDPTLVSAGQKATITFTAPSQAGTYDFRCDFHPTDSVGKIEVK